MTDVLHGGPARALRLRLLAAAAALSCGGMAPLTAVAQPASQAAGAPAAAAAATDRAPTRGTGGAPVLADRIVAVVNSEPITANELRARMASARQQFAERGVQTPAEDEFRRLVLERLISERAQLQLAREYGLTVDDGTLRQAELAVARQNQIDSVDELRRQLAAQGIALADFHADLRNQVMLQRLREREIEPKVQVSDAEVERFLREQARRSGVSATPEINLAMILVAVPEGASSGEVARLQQKAAEVAARARQGEDFAALARASSDANNRGADGGELGLRAVDRYPALFTQATQAAPVGGVVGPVRSEAGFHVLKVLERPQPDLPAVNVVQTHARHILLRLDSKQNEALARDRLNDFRRRIEAGRDSFESLARQHSQDGSADEGGDLGWASPGQFVPEFEQVMNNLRPGQISEPVRSRFGMHLIQVQERREQRLSPEQQRELARNMLRERKAVEAFETWAQEVRGRAYVELRDAPQ